MQWQIINHLNELLITRVFYAAGIKVSPPIEIPGTFSPIASEPYPPRVLFIRAIELYRVSRDNRTMPSDMNTRRYPLFQPLTYPLRFAKRRVCDRPLTTQDSIVEDARILRDVR